MKYEASTTAIAVFAAFVGLTLGLSFYFGRRAKSAQAYFAAGGSIHKPKFSIGPYGFCALVVDTEGNCIDLHSMK